MRHEPLLESCKDGTRAASNRECGGRRGGSLMEEGCGCVPVDGWVGRWGEGRKVSDPDSPFRTLMKPERP